MSAPSPVTSDKATSDVTASKSAVDRVDASRSQASTRRVFGQFTEIHAYQRNTAQNEGRNGRGQVHAAGQTTGRDRAFVGGRRQHVGQKHAADRVDGPFPAFALKRLAQRL